MSDKQIETIINHEIALEDSHPKSEKPKYFGEIIKQDVSIHLWFGEKTAFYCWLIPPLLLFFIWRKFLIKQKGQDFEILV